MTLHVEGLRWHDPDHAARGALVAGVPSHSYGYGVVVPPRSWDRGILGTPCISTSGDPLYSLNSLLEIAR
jgi:hypothetical protein